MTRVSATEIRDDMADIVNRVAYGGERIILDRRGKDVAAIVSMDDLRRLEEIENAHWAKEADRALADAERRGEQPIPFEQIERRIDAGKRARRGTAARKRQRAAR